MKIALFACDKVGFEITKFLADCQETLGCLVLDSKDRNQYNRQIIEASVRDSNLTIFYSDEIYNSHVINEIHKLKLDIGILAWWPYILEQEIILIPKQGFINLHPSLLPYNRGKDPNFWNLLEGSPFGVSIHFVDPFIDSGDIIFQSPIEKTWEDTGQTLYNKATKEIVDLFKNNFHIIKSGKLRRKPQQKNVGSLHFRKEIEAASRIDLDKKYKARDLLNIIRARTFFPHPGAWFIDDGERYEVRIDIKKSNKQESSGS